MFSKNNIISMIVAAFCLTGGLFIIIFNIILYPKFNSIIYSVVGLFLIILILIFIAVRIYIKYRKTRRDSDIIEQKVDEIKDESED